jgi:hypothetical protein
VSWTSGRPKLEGLAFTCRHTTQPRCLSYLSIACRAQPHGVCQKLCSSSALRRCWLPTAIVAALAFQL